ncbi:hypothetical protein [Lactiplantibacillus daowaiensis]|uniref:Cardiolipin synthase N-terminal domain-containing protein n=1 Tax=Lactiplantibacillus daowaiensis TaxID=2559918 RepID=A0ABW1S203_9LACO|nr:hypothetical protein [Lactiplantibacillus daowaiensis]
MEITVNFIIGTSGLLALICFWQTVVSFRHGHQTLMAWIWLIAGLLFTGLAGFFIWAMIPLWTSL